MEELEIPKNTRDEYLELNLKLKQALDDLNAEQIVVLSKQKHDYWIEHLVLPYRLEGSNFVEGFEDLKLEELETWKESKNANVTKYIFPHLKRSDITRTEAVELAIKDFLESKEENND